MVQMKGYQFRRRNSFTPKVKVSLYKRRILGYSLVLFVISFPLYMLYAEIADTYGGNLFTTALCEEVRSGAIAGELCSFLCRENTLAEHKVRLNNFIKDEDGYRVFEWKDILYKVKLSHITELKSYRHHLKDYYDTPDDGAGVVEFRNMVVDFLKQKLGEWHKEFANYIFQITDINRDGKLSLGEARTIWSLLHHREFLMAMIFHSADYVPKVESFCGDVYSIEKVSYEYLHEPKDFGIQGWLFPNKYTWWFPPWPHRARIIMGILDFTQEIHQHGQLGQFFMCEVNEQSIGYTHKYDAKLIQVGKIISYAEFVANITFRTCIDDADCKLTNACQTYCDKGSKRCTADLIQPMLSHVCEIISSFIVKGAPKVITGDLLHILEKCQNLQTRHPQFDLEHSLILNDLKLLIWKQIHSIP